MFQPKSTLAAVQKSIRRSKRRGATPKGAAGPAGTPPRGAATEVRAVTLVATPSGIDMKLGKDPQNRLRVCDTTPRGAADAAGIEPGDVIHRIGATAITGSTSVSQAILLLDANNGQSTVIGVTRCGDPVPPVSGLSAGRARTDSSRGRPTYKTVVVRANESGRFGFDVLGPAEGGGVLLKCGDPAQPVVTGDVILGVMGETVTPRNWDKILYSMGPKITIDIMHFTR